MNVSLAKYAAVVEWQTHWTWLMISIYRNRGSTYISHQKSSGGDVVRVQVPSAAPNLYVFQFLLNGLNRNDRFGSFKCENYHLIWRYRISVSTQDFHSCKPGSTPGSVTRTVLISGKRSVVIKMRIHRVVTYLYRSNLFIWSQCRGQSLNENIKKITKYTLLT